MTTPIPPIHRTFFTTLDPMIASLGVLGNLFMPASILKSYTPDYQTPIANETTVLLNSSAGYLACIMVLQIFLLRARPNDLVVWKTVQGAFCVTDVAILWALCNVLSVEGRTGVGSWRVEEWGNIGVTGLCAVLRGAFVMGVGLGGRGKGKKA